MPWRGPEVPGEIPTLGYAVGEWIEHHCVIPDGPHQGEAYRLTNEMWDFLARHYALEPLARFDVDHPSAAFAYRRSQLVRPQKWGKGPFSAAIICAEAVGPVLFGGWDAAGEPVGMPWATPWIQVTAASEDQTANVYRALLPMIQEGPLADVIPDTGQERINLPSGRIIEPVTSSAKSRLGQPITFALQDETHSWVESNGGVKLAKTQRRNLGGMGGRSIETTNAWDPAEMSVAQVTGESKLRDVYRDHKFAPGSWSYKSKADRRKIHRVVYGDSWWIDLDRIEADAAELIEAGDPETAERYFGNRIVATADSWMPGEVWDARAVERVVPPRSRITVGFDGSDTDDWTAFRCETLDGFQFTPCFPDGKPMVWDPKQHGGLIPRAEVSAGLAHLMATFDVVRAYCDPPGWQSEIDAWAAQYGDKKVVRFETYRTAQMAAALERLQTDVRAEDSAFAHDGCETTAEHMRNARKSRRQLGGKTVFIIQKDRPGSQRKIDAAMSSALAHEAAGDAIAAGEGKRTKHYVYTD